MKVYRVLQLQAIPSAGHTSEQHTKTAAKERAGYRPTNIIRANRTKQPKESRERRAEEREALDCSLIPVPLIFHSLMITSFQQDALLQIGRDIEQQFVGCTGEFLLDSGGGPNKTTKSPPQEPSLLLFTLRLSVLSPSLFPSALCCDDRFNILTNVPAVRPAGSLFCKRKTSFCLWFRLDRLCPAMEKAA